MKFAQIELLFFVLIFISCNDSSTPLDSFFDKVEQKVANKKALQEFMAAPIDSGYNYHLIFSEQMEEVYLDSTSNMALYEFLHSKEIYPETELGYLVLVAAFHSKLNNKKVDIEEIKDEMLQLSARLEAEEKAEKKRHDQENLKIIQANNELWDEGDTLNIILPVRLDERYGSKSAYYSYGYPLTLDYSSADDTLKVKGILLQKFYEKYSNLDIDSIGVGPGDLVFKLKILEWSDTNIRLLGTKYKVGDDFDLHLEAYGRPIE